MLQPQLHLRGKLLSHQQLLTHRTVSSLRVFTFLSTSTFATSTYCRRRCTGTSAEVTRPPLLRAVRGPNGMTRPNYQIPRCGDPGNGPRPPCLCQCHRQSSTRARYTSPLATRGVFGKRMGGFSLNFHYRLRHCQLRCTAPSPIHSVPRPSPVQ